MIKVDNVIPTEAEPNEYRERGYWITPKLLDDDQIKLLRKEVNRILNMITTATSTLSTVFIFTTLRVLVCGRSTTRGGSMTISHVGVEIPSEISNPVTEQMKTVQ